MTQKEKVFADLCKKEIFTRRLFFLFLTVLPIVGLFCISKGAVDLSFKKVILSLFPFNNVNSTESLIITQIRLPRLICCILCGGALGISGAALQGLFRNSLSDPYMTGISSGATFGAAISIFLGAENNILGFAGTAACAFIGAIATALIFFGLLWNGKKVTPGFILLAGLSINLFFSGLVSLLMFLNHEKLDQVVLWTMGSLSSSCWNEVLFLLPGIIVGCTLLLFCAKDLDIISINEELAKSRGINITKCRYTILLACALTVAVTSAFSGIIGFVGLIIPNAVRLITGPKHTRLFIFSFIFAAAFLSLCDLFARSVMPPAELPVGIITSLLGIPAFLIILFRNKS
jgi:iron complex transport system permease protein